MKTTITRSSSRKMSLGNFDKRRQYETQDFFCSVEQEIEHKESLPKKQLEEVSRELYEFCAAEVKKDYLNKVKEIIEQKRKRAENDEMGLDFETEVLMEDPDFNPTLAHLSGKTVELKDIKV